MIYFVDEDIHYLEPLAIAMQNRGYKTSILIDADEAFSTLINATDIEAIILDVMLATAEEGESRYDSVATNNFVITGLSLLDDLAAQYSSKGDNTTLKKVIIFTAAQQDYIIKKINDKLKQYKNDGIPIMYLDKKDYDITFVFADKIEEIMNNS